jgi:hypothetical protein
LLLAALPLLLSPLCTAELHVFCLLLLTVTVLRPSSCPSRLPHCCPAGSDGWFYPQHAAENASLREIIHDGFLHPKESK